MDASKKTKKPGLFKRAIGSCFAVKRWVSYDELKTNFLSLAGLFRRLFKRETIEQPRCESYEEAVMRMNLSEQDLDERRRQFLKSAICYLLVALLLWINGIWLIAHLKLLGAGIALILALTLTLNAYHEHFWYMQMSQHKLGCTFRDWLTFVLRRKAV